MDIHALIAINLRLQQREIVKGPGGKYRVLGLALYDCEQCDLSGPDEGADEKQNRNCKKPGVKLRGPGREGLDYQIDNTGIDKRDFCSFCPASVSSPSLKRQINRVLDMERLKTLGHVTARPMLHQPLRIKTFFLATLGARDRFINEINSVEIELSTPQ